MQREFVRVQERVREQATVRDRAEDVPRARLADTPVLEGHHAGESQQRDVHADDTRERIVRRHPDRESPSDGPTNATDTRIRISVAPKRSNRSEIASVSRSEIASIGGRRL